MTKQSRTYTAAAVASVVVAIAAGLGGWWVVHRAGSGRGGSDVKVIGELPPTPGTSQGSGANEPGGFVIPAARPANRAPVDVPLAEVPSWFRSAAPEPPAVRSVAAAALPGRAAAALAAVGGTAGPSPSVVTAAGPAAGGRAVLPPVARPADALAEARPVLSRRRALSAWFARWQADVGAERPVTDARLRELETLLEGEVFTTAEAGTVGRAIAAAEGPAGRTAGVWSRAARTGGPTSAATLVWGGGGEPSLPDNSFSTRAPATRPEGVPTSVKSGAAPAAPPTATATTQPAIATTQPAVAPARSASRPPSSAARPTTRPGR